MEKKDLEMKNLREGSEKIILKTLISMLGIDIDMIEDERDEKGIPKDDPRRNEMSLRLSSFSIPFAISTDDIENLRQFFKEKGWEFVKITSSPSIKLKKIQSQKQ